jgi:hypothetical protein
MAPVDNRRFGGPEDSVDYRVYINQTPPVLNPDKRRYKNRPSNILE